MSSENKSIGGSLAGGTGIFERIKDDFYATDPISTRSLFENTDISGESFYEPCIGQAQCVLLGLYGNKAIQVNQQFVGYN